MPDQGGDRRAIAAAPQVRGAHGNIPLLTGAALTRLLVVEHDSHAPAGLLGGWATAGGLAVTTVALHAGEPLPPAGAATPWWSSGPN